MGASKLLFRLRSALSELKPGSALRGAKLSSATAEERSPDLSPRWSHQALAGRLTELSGVGAHSALTACMLLLLDAQRAQEPCAWVTRPESTFFPPDLMRAGVDLEALGVIFVPSAPAAASAACRLVRSGAFGLVVVDLGLRAELPLPLQGRLSGLALKHDAAVVLITEKPASAPSVGSMISLRLQAQRTRLDEARFSIRLEALKDKRQGPGWIHEEVVHGPDGLR